MANKRLVIFDGSNIIKRGYYAVPMMRTSTGLPTNAVKGVVNIVGKLLYSIDTKYAAFVLDHPSKNTFRHQIYPEYKQGREVDEEVEANLAPQRTIIRRLLKAMGILVISKAYKEADDIIGTLTKLGSNKLTKVIVSQDKDFAQLIRQDVVQLRYNRARKDYDVVNVENCKEFFTVEPKHVVEFLMLLGDGVDNIPGVRGIGPSTAAKILSNGPLSKYASADINTSQINAIRKAWPNFKLTRKLITIDTRAVDIKLSTLERREPNIAAIDEICDILESSNMRRDIRRYLNNK
jgi:DNA polymerase-1